MDLSVFSQLNLSLEADGKVVLLELDHGKTNEMGSAQLREFELLTAQLEADPHAVALISWSQRKSSRGTPLFVAGANVTERVGWDDERVKAHVAWQRRTLFALSRAPVFHIAVVDGVALGWGTEYLLTADYVLGGDASTYGLPETSLGILPGAGGTATLWSRIGVSQALRLGMTAERISPDEAARIGLVDERVTDNAAGLARARALAGRVAKNSPTAVAAYKRAVRAAVGQPLEAALALEVTAYEHCVDSGEAAVGRTHFANIRKGEPVPWSDKTLQ